MPEMGTQAVKEPSLLDALNELDRCSMNTFELALALSAIVGFPVDKAIPTKEEKVTPYSTFRGKVDYIIQTVNRINTLLYAVNNALALELDSDLRLLK